MKKLLVLSGLALSVSTMAADFQLQNLTKTQVEKLTREFSGNFAHTTVSAPETKGLWGLEVGLIGGKASSPEIKSVVDASGGKGSDFESLYHAGAVARAHGPFDLFVELNVLPEQKISDVKFENRSFEVGWNFGSFFELPLDLAIGANWANSDLAFTQSISGGTADVKLNSRTAVQWIGVSKTFLFFTPYVKFGRAQSDSDLKATGNITVINYQTAQKDTAKNDGSYIAAGANLQLLFLKFGAEVSTIMGVKRATGKISFDF